MQKPGTRSFAAVSDKNEEKNSPKTIAASAVQPRLTRNGSRAGFALPRADWFATHYRYVYWKLLPRSSLTRQWVTAACRPCHVPSAGGVSTAVIVHVCQRSNTNNGGRNPAPLKNASYGKCVVRLTRRVARRYMHWCIFPSRGNFHP